MIHQAPRREPGGDSEEPVQGTQPDGGPHRPPARRRLAEFGEDPDRAGAGRPGDPFDQQRGIPIIEAIEEKVRGNQVIFFAGPGENPGIADPIPHALSGGPPASQLQHARAEIDVIHLCRTGAHQAREEPPVSIAEHERAARLCELAEIAQAAALQSAAEGGVFEPPVGGGDAVAVQLSSPATGRKKRGLSSAASASTRKASGEKHSRARSRSTNASALATSALARTGRWRCSRNAATATSAAAAPTRARASPFSQSSMATQLIQHRQENSSTVNTSAAVSRRFQATMVAPSANSAATTASLGKRFSARQPCTAVKYRPTAPINHRPRANSGAGSEFQASHAAPAPTAAHTASSARQCRRQNWCRGRWPHPRQASSMRSAL